MKRLSSEQDNLPETNSRTLAPRSLVSTTSSLPRTQELTDIPSHDEDEEEIIFGGKETVGRTWPDLIFHFLRSRSIIVYMIIIMMPLLLYQFPAFRQPEYIKYPFSIFIILCILLFLMHLVKKLHDYLKNK